MDERFSICHNNLKKKLITLMDLVVNNSLKVYKICVVLQGRLSNLIF